MTGLGMLVRYDAEAFGLHHHRELGTQRAFGVAEDHWPDSEVVPVRAVSDVFVAQPRVDAADDSNHVIRGHVLETVLHRCIDDDAGRNRSEISRLRLLAQRREVETRLSQERSGSAVGNPAAHPDRSWQRGIAW